MAYFTTLYSGSSGNCALIRSEDKYLLIDAGISCRRITVALKELGLTPADLTAILITHTHSDHIAGLQTLLKRWDGPVFASEEVGKFCVVEYNIFCTRFSMHCAQNVFYCARTICNSVHPAQTQRPLFWRALQKVVLLRFICGDTGWQCPPAGCSPGCDHCAGS